MLVIYPLEDAQQVIPAWRDVMRMEYHPELTGTPNVLQLGLLGREVYGQHLLPV